MPRGGAVDTSIVGFSTGQGGWIRLSDVFDFAPAASELLRRAAGASIGYLVWGSLHDSEREYAHSLMAGLTEDQDVRHEAAMRRSEKLRAIGSQATFFSGLARIDGELRSVRVAVTPQEFVLFDNWTHVDPVGELACLPRESVTQVVIVDENGNEVADQLIDPIHELETPEEERYAVVLKRRGAHGELPPASFLFRSGEPALECRDRYRRFIASSK